MAFNDGINDMLVPFPTGDFTGGIAGGGCVFPTGGFNPVQQRDATTTLCITGGDKKADMPLHVGGPQLCGGPVETGVPPSTGNLTYLSLFTQGPEAFILPLFIGKEVESNSGIPLYLESPIATGDPNATLQQSQLALVIGSGALGSPFPTDRPSDIDDPDSTDHPSAIPFFITAPLIGSGVGFVSLNLATEPIPSVPSDPDGTPRELGPGVVPHSGFMTIAVSGANPGAVTTSQDGQSTLFIGNQAIASSGLLIHMERNTGQMIPLQITNTIQSGVMTASISGCYCVASGVSLFTHAPTTKILKFNISGYTE